MTPRADYRAEPELPALVRGGLRLAAELRFENSCGPGYGRLLRTLAARGGLIGELGTGCGVGTAWMLDGMPSTAHLITIEMDPIRAAAARVLLAVDPRAEVLEGDSRRLLKMGPFDLLFADGGGKDPDWADEVVAALRRPGGTLVLDDLMWGEPPGQDQLGSLWLGHPSLVATKVMTHSPNWAPIIATRRES